MSLAGRLLQRIHSDTIEADDVAASGAALPTGPEVAPAITVVPAAGAAEDVLADLRKEALEETAIIGLSELRAAAFMVAEGEATRVVLTAFPAWPGLLTEIERLSREFDLSILPTIVRGGGRIDIVVSPPEGDGD